MPINWINMERKKALNEVPKECELPEAADGAAGRIQEEAAWKTEAVMEAKNGADRLFELGQQYLIAGETKKAIYFFNSAMMGGDYRSEFYYGLLTLGEKGREYYEKMDMMAHAASELMDPTLLIALGNILESRILDLFKTMQNASFLRLVSSCDCSMGGLYDALNDYVFESDTRKKRKKLRTLTIVTLNVLKRGLHLRPEYR